MAYDFSFVRLQPSVRAVFPASLEGFPHNPLGGPFTASEQRALVARLEALPGMVRVTQARDYFELDAGGFLSIWVTSDGGVYLESQAGLELTLEVFRHLQAMEAALVLEDPQLGLLHDVSSFAAWIGGGAQLSAQATAQASAHAFATA